MRRVESLSLGLTSLTVRYRKIQTLKISSRVMLDSNDEQERDGGQAKQPSALAFRVYLKFFHEQNLDSYRPLCLDNVLPFGLIATRGPWIGLRQTLAL